MRALGDTSSDSGTRRKRSATTPVSWLLAEEKTWETYLGSCTASLGLMRRAHVDGAHTGARQSTSFVLAISYLVTLPSLYSTLGTANATVVFGIQLIAVVLVILGMTLDAAWVFPDNRLAAGKGPSWAVCRSCGCIATSHAIWHFLSVVAAIQTAFSREYALRAMR